MNSNIVRVVGRALSSANGQRMWNRPRRIVRPSFVLEASHRFMGCRSVENVCRAKWQ